MCGVSAVLRETVTGVRVWRPIQARTAQTIRLARHLGLLHLILGTNNHTHNSTGTASTTVLNSRAKFHCNINDIDTVADLAYSRAHVYS